MTVSTFSGEVQDEQDLGVCYERRELVRIRLAEKIELRRKLIKAFRFNVAGLKKMHGLLTSQPPIIPDYRLDTESVSHILFHGRNLFDDEGWFDKFNWQRFQLVHINAQVDFLNEIHNLSDISPRSIFPQGGLFHRRYASLVKNLQIIQEEILQTIAEYERVA
jgi:hypothetical protein